MLLLKEAYENDAILKLFPKPNYSHISPNIKVGDAIWIDFDDIYIDEMEDVEPTDDELNAIESELGTASV